MARAQTLILLLTSWTAISAVAPLCKGGNSLAPPIKGNITMIAEAGKRPQHLLNFRAKAPVKHGIGLIKNNILHVAIVHIALLSVLQQLLWSGNKNEMHDSHQDDQMQSKLQWWDLVSELPGGTQNQCSGASRLGLLPILLLLPQIVHL
ncbi:MAG: hypothetical protein FRX49_09796 [Trebouxia sp. A1-2]|nr:MAG: hypothetical protein FRX49_09796 [Trebouxia sp. A1-2]